MGAVQVRVDVSAAIPDQRAVGQYAAAAVRMIVPARFADALHHLYPLHASGGSDTIHIRPKRSTTIPKPLLQNVA